MEAGLEAYDNRYRWRRCLHRRRHRWARACQNKISPANMGQPHKLAIADWMIVNLSGICHVSRYGCHILCPCQRKPPPSPSTTSYATRSPGFNRCCRRRRRGHSLTVKARLSSWCARTAFGCVAVTAQSRYRDAHIAPASRPFIGYRSRHLICECQVFPRVFPFSFFFIFLQLPFT